MAVLKIKKKNNSSFSSLSILKFGKSVLTTPKENFVLIGGRKYKTAKMPDGKTWLAENLDLKWDGLVLNSSSSNSDVPYAYYYDKDENTYGFAGKKFGLLYNFPAVSYIEKNKLIPGWHVATKEEWANLFDSVDNNILALRSATDNGSAAGTDDFGFNLKGAGVFIGYFSGLPNAFIWTSTTISSTYTWDIQIRSNSFTIKTDYINTGMSVRLVKDE